MVCSWCICQRNRLIVGAAFILLLGAMSQLALAQGMKESASEIKSALQVIKQPTASGGERRAARKKLVQIGAPAVPWLIRAMDNEAAGKEAQKALILIGAPAIPALLECLTTTATQYGAQKTLGYIGRPAVPALVDFILHQRDFEARAAAVDALHDIGPSPLGGKAAPEFMRMFQNGDQKEKMLALMALDSLGIGAQPAMPLLIETLGNEALENGAGRALVSIGPPYTTPALVKALKHSRAMVRQSAATLLRMKGTPARLVVPALIEALNDPDTKVRASAARTLGEHGTKARAASRALSKLLSDPDPEVQANAAQALGKLGPALEVDAQPLVAMLVNSHEGVRLGAVEALYGLKAPVDAARILPELKRRLASPDQRQRLTAIFGLSALGKAGLPPLLDALRHGDAWTREYAAIFLEGFVPDDAAALKALIDALDDPEPKVRSAAMSRLPNGPCSAPAVPKLLQRLSHPDRETRDAAASKLAMIGTDVMPELFRLIRSGDSRTRQAAINAIGNMDVEAGAAIPDLVKLLHDQDVEVRRNAAWALYRVGPQDPAILPTLVEAYQNDKDPETHDRLGDCLMKFGAQAKAALPTLVEDLRRAIERDDQNSIGSIRILGAMGADAKPAVPLLIRALRGSNWQRHGEAAVALEQIGPEAREAIPALIEVLEGEDGPSEGSYAVSALSAMGPSARKAVPAILDVIKLCHSPCSDETEGSEDETRQNAHAALCRIDPHFVPELLKTLGDEEEDPRIRAEAAEALGRIGTLAKPAVPLMARIVSDEQEPDELRQKTMWALSELGTNAREAIPQLVELLNRGEYFRRALFDTLGAAGPAASAAIPDLIKALQDPDNGIKDEAARALGAMGYKAQEAVAELEKLRKCNNPQVRQAAYWAIWKIKHAERDAGNKR